MSALAVEGNLERWLAGVGVGGKRYPIVWDVEWSNAKIIKIKYMVA